MKRYSVKELETLLKGTTEGEWDENRIGTVFRSSSFERGKNVLMAGVKNDKGSAGAIEMRPNAVLMSIARNLAEELLDLKTHRYGQEDCCGCEDRDSEIEKLKERIACLESTNGFEAARLRRLANLVGAATPGPSDEELLGCAGTVLGSICGIVERLLKTRELECKDCQHINFHEQCHDVQEKTAIRCMEVITSFDDGFHPLGMQGRMAAAIRDEFGVDSGMDCPACCSSNTITTGAANRVQGDGQETGVTTYLCLPCRNVWSE